MVMIAVRRKKPLTIWINWVESIIFFIFVLYSIGTAIIHVVYLSREYAYNYKKRQKDPSYFANKSASLEEHFAVEILEIFVQLSQCEQHWKGKWKLYQLVSHEDDDGGLEETDDDYADYKAAH
ncbi:hypothetical protein C9374_009301 [Naegleria lovaniensis]|uniref:Uncharacterized protein n=1 Tax=Naegleria lovaniensis TaxID=51637 RepID=A0AA88GIF5_NAELO|nr:uncharacterized protein C9374_009301 [Naegleria lovaniensis]KAG2377390.1 hypothetical protein C9374_009301 [Naegleria lovaniensis]